MIDFHTHILPGVDDGSRSAAESIDLLSAEAQQGITRVILTPHYYAHENSPVEFLKKRYNAWKELEPHLSPELPDVRLGAEVQYFEGICAVSDIHHLRIEGTELLLLEMPFCQWTDRMVTDVLDLNDQPDTQVVLAHIERYIPMQAHGIWEQLKSYGILMQSNVSFFANWKTRHRAMSMLRRGEIDFLGSDCHNMKNRHPNWNTLPPKARDKIQSVEAYHKLLYTWTDGIQGNQL